MKGEALNPLTHSQALQRFTSALLEFKNLFFTCKLKPFVLKHGKAGIKADIASLKQLLDSCTAIRATYDECLDKAMKAFEDFKRASNQGAYGDLQPIELTLSRGYSGHRAMGELERLITELESLGETIDPKDTVAVTRAYQIHGKTAAWLKRYSWLPTEMVKALKSAAELYEYVQAEIKKTVGLPDNVRSPFRPQDNSEIELTPSMPSSLPSIRARTDFALFEN